MPERPSDHVVVSAEELAEYHDQLLQVLRPLRAKDAHFVLDAVRSSLRLETDDGTKKDW